MNETYLVTNDTRKFILSLLEQLDMNIMRLKTEMQGMPLSKIAEEMTVNVTLCNACVKACLKATNQ
jgi:hypothetical protein